MALQNLPVVFAMDRAGIVGADGPTHHGVFDIPYMRIFPNMVVAAPGDENDVVPLLRWAGIALIAGGVGFVAGGPSLTSHAHRERPEHLVEVDPAEISSEVEV